MKRTQARRSSTTTSRQPFFPKASVVSNSPAFFPVVQPMAEPAQIPEEEEPQLQMQTEKTTVQKQTTREEEENVVQTSTMHGMAIQRKCTACAKEQQESSRLQTKLTVGQPNDHYEQEADRVADQVVYRLQAPQSRVVQPQSRVEAPSITPMVMRQGHGQTSVHSQTAQKIQHTRGGGQPLDRTTRSSMEKAFGTDFSRVRVHANSGADQLNQSLNARAFTTGQDIYFRQGEYQPRSQPGQRLLAHELTHVVQQNATSSSIISRQAMLPPNPGDDPRIHPKGAPNASSCGAPGHCPANFCKPYKSKSYAMHQRTKMLPILMTGIALAVNRRVVPLWHEYLLGGSAPKNLTSEFGADFAVSPTTVTTSQFLGNALSRAIARSPFVAPASGTKLDMTAWIASEVAAINTAGNTNEMDFNFPSDIAGNLAGGIGTNQTTCKSGAKPSPFNDQRLATVMVEFTTNPDGTTTAQPIISYIVKDTIDLCPGNCGTAKEQIATVPMSQFEATGISGDVPFTIEFEHRPASFTV